jgi:hypothetical protein
MLGRGAWDKEAHTGELESLPAVRVAGWEAKGGAVLNLLWRLNLKFFDNPVQEFAVDDAR